MEKEDKENSTKKTKNNNKTTLKKDKKSKLSVDKKNKKNNNKDTNNINNKKEVKKEKKNKEEKVSKKSKVSKEKVVASEIDVEETIIEENHNGKYIFIYIFMAIMLIALLGLVFSIVNEKFSLIYKNPIATVTLEDYGSFKIELEITKAPNTVTNFIKLAQAGFYDNKVVYGKDAVSLHFGRGARGEEPTATASIVDKSIEEGSFLDIEYQIDGEFEKNNFKKNDINHEKYVVSLVRADYSDIIEKIQHYSYNAGTPMFKILIDNAPGMNGNYTAFGRVIEGKDVIDKLVERELRFEIETEEDKEELNEFKDFVKIESITVDLFNMKLKDVKLHEKFSIENFILQLYQEKYL